MPEEYLVNILQEKIGTILSVAYINESLFNKFKRQLINYYHPDSGNVQDSTVLTMIADELQTIKITKGVL